MPAFKGTKVLGTLQGGFHPKGTAPIAGKTGAYGPRTTDPDMVSKPSMGSDGEGYVRAMRSEKPKKTKKMAKGGSVSSRADGIARKGKTRGKMC